MLGLSLVILLGSNTKNLNNWMNFHIYEWCKALNIGNFLFFKKGVKDQHFWWIVSIITIGSIYTIWNKNFSKEIILCFSLVLFIFGALILYLPFPKFRLLVVGCINRIIGITGLTLVISFFICLFKDDFNITLFETLHLSKKIVGMWCTFSIILSLTSRSITKKDLLNLFIGLVTLMLFYSLFTVILGSVFLSLLIWLNNELDLGYLYMNNSGPSGSNGGPSGNNPGNGNGGGNGDYGDFWKLTDKEKKEKEKEERDEGPTTYYWSSSTKCYKCIVKFKLQLRETYGWFDNKNVLEDTGRDDSLHDRHSKTALLDAVSESTGIRDFLMVKDSKKHNKDMLTASGKAAKDGHLISDKLGRGYKAGSVNNTKSNITRLYEYLDHPQKHIEGSCASESSQIQPLKRVAEPAESSPVPKRLKFTEPIKFDKSGKEIKGYKWWSHEKTSENVRPEIEHDKLGRVVKYDESGNKLYFDKSGNRIFIHANPS